MLGSDLFSSAIVDIVTAGEVDETGKTVRQYSMALDKDGRLFTWGYNYHGVTQPASNKLDETTGDYAITTLPVNISSSNATLGNALTLSADKIAANARILKKDGQIISWGQNDAEHRAYGGYGLTEQPERAILGGRALEVNGGVYNAVAVTTGGQVKTWGGDNTNVGQADATGRDTRYANGKHDVVIMPGEQLIDENGNPLYVEEQLKHTDAYGSVIYVLRNDEGAITSYAYKNIGTDRKSVV